MRCASKPYFVAFWLSRAHAKTGWVGWITMEEEHERVQGPAGRQVHKAIESGPIAVDRDFNHRCRWPDRWRGVSVSLSDGGSGWLRTSGQTDDEEDGEDTEPA